jgi:hypothetical protein
MLGRLKPPLSKALQAAEEGLARFPRNLPPEQWLASVNPYSILSYWRGACLCWTGRLREGLSELGRSRRLTEEDGTPEGTAYMLGFAAEGYYQR